VTARALAAHPPTGKLALGVRPRLLLTWGLSSGVPMVGVVLMFLDPSNPDGPGHGAVVFLVVVALLVGALATLLTARAVGQPLRDLRTAVQQVGDGDYDVSVVVDDAGEIGLLQQGVNTMAAGLAERERLRDLFGRHVGTSVAQQALAEGVSLGGELRTVAALFVDIAGSTSLVRRTGPEEMVGLLNRFFEVVVETVEAEGGLVNKFEGDAALCVFGAPAAHADAATGVLTAARTMAERLQPLPLDAAIGVAAGPVVAGHVGAESRFEYTVIGDPVNAAARLAELAKGSRGCVLADAAVVAQATPGEMEHWEPAEEVVLRGRDRPTRLARPA
jgi:adenylate cyclase